MQTVLKAGFSCAAGEIGGAAQAKGEQANELQRAAGEATGRDGKQIPDKMQQIGDQSGEQYIHPTHCCLNMPS